MAKKTFTKHINFDELTADPLFPKKRVGELENTPRKGSEIRKNTHEFHKKRFQTSLSIDEDLHKNLKILGCNLKKPLRQIIEDALKEYLEKYNI